MAEMQISIDTFFSSLNPWDASVGEATSKYADYVEQVAASASVKSD